MPNGTEFARMRAASLLFQVSLRYDTDSERMLLSTRPCHADVDGPAGPTNSITKACAADDPVNGDPAAAHACAGRNASNRRWPRIRCWSSKTSTRWLPKSPKANSRISQQRHRSENEKELVVDNDTTTRRTLNDLQNMMSELAEHL